MTTHVSDAIGAAADAMDQFPYDSPLRADVLHLTQTVLGAGGSPCDDTLVLARTLMSASIGMGHAILNGLHPTEIHDREKLRHTVAALRASADIFEAIVRDGAQ